MTDTGPLFVSSGDLVSDRRYKAAVELAAHGDFAAAADVLMQTVEVAPGFATAWFALGAIRDRLGDRDGAVAATRPICRPLRRRADRAFALSRPGAPFGGSDIRAGPQARPIRFESLLDLGCGTGLARRAACRDAFRRRR